MWSPGLSKKEFKMAAQVHTTDDILWTKFLLHLRKFSHSKINQHSKDSGNMEIGDNRNGVLIEIINSLQLHQIPFWRFCDLRLEKHFSESCEVFFLFRIYWYALVIWSAAGQGSSTTKWRRMTKKKQNTKLLNREEVTTQFHQFNRSLIPILFRVKWTSCAHTLYLPPVRFSSFLVLVVELRLGRSGGSPWNTRNLNLSEKANGFLKNNQDIKGKIKTRRGTLISFYIVAYYIMAIHSAVCWLPLSRLQKRGVRMTIQQRGQQRKQQQNECPCSARVKSHHLITWWTINGSMSTKWGPLNSAHPSILSNGPETLINVLHCSITIKSTEALRGCQRKNWPLEFRRITEFLEIFSVRWLVHSIGKNRIYLACRAISPKSSDDMQGRSQTKKIVYFRVNLSCRFFRRLNPLTSLEVCIFTWTVFY